MTKILISIIVPLKYSYQTIGEWTGKIAVRKRFEVLFLLFFCFFTPILLQAQAFYLGADLSYVNEMEDCGVEYFENGVQTDPYEIFANHNCNLVRLRLWHTPSWYDELNSGKRYSDLADVKKAIGRAKEQNMEVLLDFHLSDNWADPNKQLVPAAWLSVVYDLEALKDSLYQYIHQTLTDLDEENLLPEMIQIGNETNRGILLSPIDNAQWTLEWERNAALFNEAIQAVKDFEAESNKDVKIALHVAGPENAEWLMDGFVTNGVTDFDIIGLSYYWAWHQPTSITDAGNTIRTLRHLYPDKEVMILETGYIWTTDSNDNANNIISDTHLDYSPASPVNQRDWLIDLTEEVIASGGKGVLYWEPAWVSSSCYTQWGQGSHQEHAAFFDFNNNLLQPGGIEWMGYDYDLETNIEVEKVLNQIQILTNSFSGDIKIKQHTTPFQKLQYAIADTSGKIHLEGSSQEAETLLQLKDVPFGVYFVRIEVAGLYGKTKKFTFGSH